MHEGVKRLYLAPGWEGACLERHTLGAVVVLSDCLGVGQQGEKRKTSARISSTETAGSTWHPPPGDSSLFGRCDRNSDLQRTHTRAPKHSG